MNRTDCVELGYISKAHGLKGDVKAVFDVHDIEEYKDLRIMLLAKGDASLHPYRVARFHIQAQKYATLRFEGISDRIGAEALVGHTIFFPEGELPKLEEGRFYYFEVIGYTIQDQNLGELGVVAGFYDGPAQDIMAMTYQSKEVLIPMTDQFVLKADHAEKRMYTHLPDGLLASYLEE
ncbi:MAG: ribosome maturation factor RimM [Bacteroidota bacterium]